VFTYDLANRLRTTTLGSTTFTYTYDGDGKRLQANSGTQTANKTNYLWDPNGFLPLLVRESDGKDVLRRRYVYGADLISMTTSAGPFYYHHDGLGSVANLTSAAGTPQWTYTYEPFGSLKSEVNNDPTAPTNLMRFTGQYFEAATGLYHLRARQYDPATGRFLSPDPVSPRTDTSYIGSYVYAANRPTVFTDPSGACVFNDDPCPGHDLVRWFGERLSCAVSISRCSQPSPQPNSVTSGIASAVEANASNALLDRGFQGCLSSLAGSPILGQTLGSWLGVVPKWEVVIGEVLTGPYGSLALVRLGIGAPGVVACAQLLMRGPGTIESVK
jgi:RHS repeat-associated protein